MKWFPLRWIMVCTTLTVAACGLFKPEKDPPPGDKPIPDGPKLVGRVASIPPEKHFVLIQSYGKWKVETDTILTTRGVENRSANLRVTGESLGQFAAADLQSGTVEVGDAVYSRHVPSPEEPSETPITPGAPPDPLPELPQSQ